MKEEAILIFNSSGKVFSYNTSVYTILCDAYIQVLTAWYGFSVVFNINQFFLQG